MFRKSGEVMEMALCWIHQYCISSFHHIVTGFNEYGKFHLDWQGTLLTSENQVGLYGNGRSETSGKRIKETIEKFRRVAFSNGIHILKDIIKSDKPIQRLNDGIKVICKQQRQFRQTCQSIDSPRTPINNGYSNYTNYSIPTTDAIVTTQSSIIDYDDDNNNNNNENNNNNNNDEDNQENNNRQVADNNDNMNDACDDENDTVMETNAGEQQTNLTFIKQTIQLYDVSQVGWLDNSSVLAIPLSIDGDSKSTLKQKTEMQSLLFLVDRLYQIEKNDCLPSYGVAGAKTASDIIECMNNILFNEKGDLTLVGINMFTINRLKSEKADDFVVPELNTWIEHIVASLKALFTDADGQGKQGCLFHNLIDKFGQNIESIFTFYYSTNDNNETIIRKPNDDHELELLIETIEIAQNDSMNIVFKRIVNNVCFFFLVVFVFSVFVVIYLK